MAGSGDRGCPVRGFIRNRLEAGIGPAPAVAAVTLYSLYHVGYGMGGEEMWFLILIGLGVVWLAHATSANALRASSQSEEH